MRHPDDFETFYKWIGNEEYPDKVKWISTTMKRSNNTLPKDMLNEEDVQDLIEAAYNARDKAVISVLRETDARIGELIDLTISDLEDHDHGKKVVIRGKTGARRIVKFERSSFASLRTESCGSFLVSSPTTAMEDNPILIRNLRKCEEDKKGGRRT